MNIQVRIATAQAQAEIRRLRAQIKELETQVAMANRTSSNFGIGGLKGIEKWGSQLQWAGRQLQYNFTIPILLATGAATKFALDNEAAATRLKKVYGDGSRGAQFYAREINSLGKAFEGLSNHFGVARSDVLNIAADWAAAGASGLALAKATKLTLETMILGELDAETATKSLIAIQAQYRLSTEGLVNTIDILNMVENQTGASMADLIDGFGRAAGVARDAGVDTRHLAAMIATLTPAAGSAAQAGNAMKTIISRLLSPTKEAAEVMGLMGINTKDFAWQSLNGTQRIEAMAKAFTNTSDAQKAVVASTIASRWQINKFSVLMNDIASQSGYYKRALDSTASAVANQAQREKELNMVLNSSPQKLKQIWTVMQNVLADAIQPMLPAIIMLANGFKSLFTAFGSLDPNVKKLIIGILLAIAAIGPLMKIIGSAALLYGYLRSATNLAAKASWWFAKSVFGIAAAPFKAVWAGIGLITSGFMSIGGAVGKGIAALFTFIPGLAGFATSVVGVFARIPVMIGGILMSGLSRLVPIIMIGLSAMSKAAAFGIAGFFSGIMRGMSVFQSLSLGLWAAWNAAMLAITRGTGALMVAATKITHASMIALQLTFGAIFGHLWTTLAVFINTVWFGVQTGVRAAWAATVLFLTSPTRILAGMKFIMSGVAAILLGGFTKLVPLVRAGATALAAAFSGPWGWIILGVVAMLVTFRDQIGKIWNNVTGAFSRNSQSLMTAFAPVVGFFQRAVGWIEKAFWRLPQSVRDALMAVINMVKKAAEAVFGMFSKIISPFGGGSDQAATAVTAQKKANGGLLRGRGTGTSDQIPILASNGEFVVNARSTAKHRGALEAINSDRFAAGGQVGAAQAKLTTSSNVTGDLAAYKKIEDSLNGIRWNKEMANVAEGFSSALPLFKRLLADYNSLNKLLERQAALVREQQAVVDGWKDKLDKANASLQTEQDKLDALQKNLDKLTAAYDAHKTALDNYANAPIEGMKAMSDSIFENQLAQKKLQLQMLQWEKQHGSIDKIKNSMALLQGEIEKLQGNISSLRAAGAGSDITGPLQDQVDAMRASYDAMGNDVNNSPISAMQQQLEDLQQQGQMLDLENAINFDPLTRQIDQLANGMQELPFDQIIAGIQTEKAAMDALQPALDAANAAVENQKTVVDAATAARDEIQKRYDLESEKLDQLQSAYQATADTVNELEDAMRGLSTAATDNIQKLAAASDAAKALSPGAQNFKDAAGANFPDVSSNAQIGREGGIADQSKQIEDWMKQNASEMDFGNFDMFAPIKEMWNSAWAWVEEHISPTVSKMWEAVKQTVSDMFSGSGGGNLFSGIGDSFKGIWKNIQGWWNSFVDILKQLWLLFGNDISDIFNSIVDVFSRIWTEVGPALGKMFGALYQAFQAVWPIIKVVAEVIGVVLLGAIKVLVNIIASTLGPVLNFIIDLFLSIVQVVTGVFQVITAIFTGDWQALWEGVKNIFEGIWNGIFAFFNGIVQTVWGVVSGFVEGIVGFFSWLYDVIIGHSIVPDLVNGIVEWFVNAGIWLLETVSGFISGIVNWFMTLPSRTFEALVTLKNKLSETATTAFTWLWNAAKLGWSLVWNWITTLPQRAWEGLIALKDKLGALASLAWDYFLACQKLAWSNIYNWITGLPQKAWDGLIALKDKLGSVATTAMSWFGSQLKSLWDGPTGILAWFGSLPGKIGEKLSGIGAVIAGAIKTGWNSAASWINSHAISPLNSITSKFGLNIPNLPQFAKGGVIPGPVSEKDNILIAARTGEGVVVPEAVKMLGGKKGIDRLNDVSKKGGDMGDFLGQNDYGVGGSIFDNIQQWLKQGAGYAVEKLLTPIASTVENVFPRPEVLSKFVSGKLRALAEAATHWGDDQDAQTIWPVGNAPITAGFGQYPNGGVHRGVDFGVPVGTTVHAFRTGQVITSGWDTTGFGNLVEIMHANDIISRYGHNSKTLAKIGATVAAGTAISYSGNTGNSTGPHVHFEIKKNGTAVDPMPYLHGQYDRGGYLQPGITMARNASGKPEPVFTAQQWSILNQLVATSSTVLKSAVDAQGNAARGMRGGAGLSLEGRIRALENPSSTVSSRNGGTTINLYGDISLPNIKNGDDAEAFIKHLENLAG